LVTTNYGLFQRTAAACAGPRPNFAPAQPSSTGNFRLPDFWPDQPENWFAMAEVQFCLSCVTSNVDKNCHLLLALPKASYRLVSHLVTQVPEDDSYENVKAVPFSHHVLSDYQRVELMSKMEPLGARKPSDLLAAMMELCPPAHTNSPFFLFFFLQRLPREIRVLLSKEDPADIRKISEKADHHVIHYTPQQHDTVAALPLSSDDKDSEVTAVRKQGKKPPPTKKKQKAMKIQKSAAQSTMCWYNARFGEKVHSCILPCSWAENLTAGAVFCPSSALAHFSSSQTATQTKNSLWTQDQVFQLFLTSPKCPSQTQSAQRPTAAASSAGVTAAPPLC
jgi:hypothetical protein